MGHQQPAGSLAPGRLLPSAFQPFNVTNCERLSTAKSGHPNLVQTLTECSIVVVVECRNRLLPEPK